MKLLVLDNPTVVYERVIKLISIESLCALSIASSLVELTKKLLWLQPDVMVFDVDLPDGLSLTHINTIRMNYPAIRIYLFLIIMNTNFTQLH